MKFKNESNEPVLIMIEPRAELFITKPGMTIDLIDEKGNEHLNCPIYYGKDSIEFWETNETDIVVMLDGKQMEDSWAEYNELRQKREKF